MEYTKNTKKQMKEKKQHQTTTQNKDNALGIIGVEGSQMT